MAGHTKQNNQGDFLEHTGKDTNGFRHFPFWGFLVLWISQISIRFET
jgi:hypothetical protein